MFVNNSVLPIDDPSLRTLWAAENNKQTELSEQLASNPDLARTKDTDGYTPLHRAAYGNHIEAMQVRVRDWSLIAGEGGYK